MSENAIIFENVTKTFGRGNSAQTALEDVSLSIPRGEIHAIVGRSGAGKSTLVRAVNGLVPVTSGRVIVDGENITGSSAEQLRQQRRRIGMIFQHFNLYDRRTVRQNVAFPLELHGVDKHHAAKKVDDLISLVGLSDHADRYPGQLSGGQKQRVGIARALVTDPDILLSDEASSALDHETTEQILSLIAQLRDDLGLTVLLITHEPEAVKLIADAVSLIENGKIAESGAIGELVLRPETRIGSLLFPYRIDGSQDNANAENQFAVTFPGRLSEHPYLTEAGRITNSDLTIVSVASDRIAGTWYSRLHLRVSGRDGASPPAAAVRAYFEEKGVHVDQFH